MYYLTPRQLQVARLISGGLSNVEISESLGITERTVRMHSDAIKVALDVRDKRRIGAKMRELGFLDTP